MVTAAAERYLADKAPPICGLEVAKAFAQLTSKEKLYTHYVGKASWAGARIIQGQWTPQGQKLFDLLALTFSTNGKLTDLEALKQRSGVSQQDFDDVLEYTAQVRLVHECFSGYAQRHSSRSCTTWLTTKISGSPSSSPALQRAS
ncbi:hypothetical protein ID866_13138 [Astraeus odoratus]|nr:hypothetical protein ID866_13138 [Astraeus odoratus]